MKLTMRECFKKKVDRPIDGVIKADDNRQLEVELDEYVITNEIEKHLSKFLEAYNAPKSTPSVWISGFFGSGKSHLLKILSLVLEAKPVGDTTAEAIMLPKCDHDAMLKASLAKAAAMPSESILFNVDQKAQSRENILAAFQLVFDEHCGYFGAQPHIAKFERDLDKIGKFDDFKARYEKISGRVWEEGRKLGALESPNISKSYAEVSGLSDVPKDIISQYRKDNAASIEQFADQVKDYVTSKGKNFRLNFFVDEVGQFIADNVNLMTNLQTVAESLHTICKGQSWVIVTAQQDLQAVMGDLSNLKQNDFSKIQGRFPTALSLNSADVAEVIQRRLLDKTENAKSELHDMYKALQNNFDTLFRFGQGSRTYSRFKDSDHFVSSYPFIPYQFDLFSDALVGLSRHGMFQGRFASVGERSMLAVFQEVAKEIADLELGQIASFDKMFDGLKASLTSEAQNSIKMAERTLTDNEMATRVLKALFLVKYVDGFKASVQNITILLRDHFDQNSKDLREKIEAALALLETNSYIQREGEFFDFLTDEEKDVEKEIKDVEIDQSELLGALEEIFFSEVITSSNIKHETSKHAYPFGKLIDQTARGREQELKLHILSPFDVDLTEDAALANQSATNNEVVIRLGDNRRFVDDMRLYLKTQKYVRLNSTGSDSSSRDKIVHEKGEQNRRRRGELKKLAEDLIRDAKYYVRGALIEPGSGDAKAKVEKAFNELIDKVYTNLRMLRGKSFSENDLVSYAVRPDEDLIDNQVTEAEGDVLKYIDRRKSQGLKIPVSEIVDYYDKAPYGWPYAAILCQVASLVGRNRIEARLDSNILTGSEMAKEIRSRPAQRQITVQSRKEFDNAQVKALKGFHDDFFGKPLKGSDVKDLGEETRKSFETLKSDYEAMCIRAEGYPFISTLLDARPVIDQASGQSYEWYLENLPSYSDNLFTAKDDVLDPIRHFMEGPQREIYDEGKSFVGNHAVQFDNADTDLTTLQRALDDPRIFASTNALKTSLDRLKNRLEDQKGEAIEKAVKAFETMRSQISATPGFSELPSATQSEIEETISRAISEARDMNSVPEVNQAPVRFKDYVLPNLLAKISAPNSDQDSSHVSEDNFVKASDVFAPSLPALATEHDLDTYLEEMREAYLAEIKSGKRIII